ncbi:Cna B-type domain-containing protein, partial [Bacillus toyonensis]|uniref:Cna B-type domain-containing protein n=1 Tax=Bacillus toyonensis TaxID=155322 RepID=UPI000BF6C0C7
WKYAFTDLAAYDAEGNAYKYEVKEQPVNGYKSEVKGYDITNIKDPSIDSKNPPTQENSKTSVWLPKTGGTSMDMISYIAGMLLLALGGFVFVRQRMR